MKKYQIFKNNVDQYEAVKQGWSWPGFFFTWIWCYVKKINAIGTGILIFRIFAWFVPEGEIHIIFFIVDVGIMIWLGNTGNQHRNGNLRDRGYKYQGDIISQNPESAISEFVNQGQKVDNDLTSVDVEINTDDIQDIDISDTGDTTIGSESIYLEFINGPLNGQRIMVFKSTTIGRSGENNIVLNDKKVSGRHCKIHIVDDEFMVEDLNSTNGTFINGEKIKKSKLEQGDELKLSTIKIKVD